MSEFAKLALDELQTLRAQLRASAKAEARWASRYRALEAEHNRLWEVLRERGLSDADLERIGFRTIESEPTTAH